MRAGLCLGRRAGAMSVTVALGMIMLLMAGTRTASAGAASGLFSWGLNLDGQLGDGYSYETGEGPEACAFGGPESAETVGCATIPTPVAESSGVTRISPGEEHVLALTEGGVALAWGDNESGQLGDGTSGQEQFEVPLPVRVKFPTSTPIRAVAAGSEHSVGLDSFGYLWAWGTNELDQLGDEKTGKEFAEASAASVVSIAPSTTTIAAGGYHTLAVTTSGTVSAWGDNEFGQLGNGNLKSTAKPVSVKSGNGVKLTGVTSVAAGEDHSLALLTNGTVMAWGDDQSGQLGDGRFEKKREQAAAVGNLSGVVAIAAGAEHSLALLSNGTVMAWGNNEFGQLGDGTTTRRTTPVQVLGLSGVVAIAAGGNHSAALLSNGTVFTWGENEYGELGIGSSTTPLCGPVGETGICSATPTEVAGLTGVSVIAAGYDDTFAIGSYTTPKSMARTVLVGGRGETVKPAELRCVRRVRRHIRGPVGRRTSLARGRCRSR